MNPCDEYVVKTLRYLDNDLKGQELEDFRSHMESCAHCRAHLEAENALSETLHRFRPLYSAPDALRDRVSVTVVQQSSRNTTRGSLYDRVSRILSVSGALERLLSWRILVPVALAIGLCVALVPNIVHHVQAASYVETAVAMHRKFISGDLQSGLNSNSPQAVTTCFPGRVPFDFRLPVESSAGSNPACKMTGATLVSYKGSPAALVTYEAPKDKVSLLLVSSQSALVAGGDEVTGGRMTFHYRTESDFRVVTWTSDGLSYPFVSSESLPL